jgi:excisionase family DNA binding protein
MNPFPKNGIPRHQDPPPANHGPAIVFLTLAQAAKRLGITPQTLGRYLKQGRLTATKPGREWLLLEQQVEDFRKKPRPKGRPKGARTKKPPPHLPGPADPPEPGKPAPKRRRRKPPE